MSATEAPEVKPIKLCECGQCGLPAQIATYTSTADGWIKGQPKRFVAGHQSKNGNNPARKLDTEQVREIKKLLAAGCLHEEIAALYEVAASTIGAISSGRNWNWV